MAQKKLTKKPKIKNEGLLWSCMQATWKDGFYYDGVSDPEIAEAQNLASFF